MILDILAVGLVVSACLAVFLDEAVYSVSALAGVFFFTALLYLINDAIYVAIFQFTVGVGTLAILFLSGEMLSDKPKKKTSLRKLLTVVVIGALLSLPAIFLSIPKPASVGTSVQFEEALWNLRAADIILQGLVVMTVALGTAIILYEKRKGEK
ncbi:MAG: NADH-quinone oxidoreductase subunit J [Candidatus Bathyarchaeia archaeon]